MDEKYRKIFKTMPKESFSEYFNKQKRKFNQEEHMNEAIRIMEERGYTVLTEGQLVKYLACLALSLGLLTNANAKEFNTQASGGYTSQNANTSMFAKDMQKNYNLQSDVQLTDKMVQTIVDNVAKKISQRMLDEDKYEEDELFALEEWQDAVTFYKSLVKADENLGNMFSRRLDKALTQSIRIAPNIQRYVIKNG